MSRSKSPGCARDAFTLVELLIVLGVLAMLGVVVILILNPVEFLRQARDARRLSDTDTMSKALSLYETDRPSGFMGSSSTLYISVPDSSSSCANLGLSALPSGWSYHCVSSSTLGNVDGTGWIPVDLTDMSYPPPASVWAVDPVNATSSGLYYAYAAGGSYKLSVLLESERRIELAAGDGGSDPAAYEAGSNLSLAPFSHGLVGYWKFDGNHTDSSGYGNNGTPSGGVSFVAGKAGQAASFDGTGFVNLGNGPSQPFSEFTLAVWIRPTNFGTRAVIERGGFNTGEFGLFIRSDKKIDFQAYPNDFQDGGSLAGSAWNFVAATLDSAGGGAKVYLDGSIVVTDGNVAAISADTDNTYFGARLGTGSFYIGAIDEARIYNRALSANEIQAMYEASR